NGPSEFDTVVTPVASLQVPSSSVFTVLQGTQTSESIQITNQASSTTSATLAIVNPSYLVPNVGISGSNMVTVEPGDTQSVSVNIDATSIPAGTYDGVLLQVAIDGGSTIYSDIKINVVAQDLPDLQVGTNDIQPAVVNSDSSI